MRDAAALESIEMERWKNFHTMICLLEIGLSEAGTGLSRSGNGVHFLMTYDWILWAPVLGFQWTTAPPTKAGDLTCLLANRIHSEQRGRATKDIHLTFSLTASSNPTE